MNRRTFIRLLGTGLLVPYIPKVFYSIPAIVKPKNLDGKFWYKCSYSSMGKGRVWYLDERDTWRPIENLQTYETSTVIEVKWP